MPRPVNPKTAHCSLYIISGHRCVQLMTMAAVGTEQFFNILHIKEGLSAYKTIPYLSKSWKTGLTRTRRCFTLSLHFVIVSLYSLWCSSDANSHCIVPGLGTRYISDGGTWWVGSFSSPGCVNTANTSRSWLGDFVHSLEDVLMRFFT